MGLWRFRDYVSSRGIDVIEEWYSSLPKRSQVAFRQRLMHLRDRPQSEWESPSAKPYAKRLPDGIWEIRFLKDDVQHRPLGFFGPRAGEFTLLMGAAEKGGRFVPRDARRKAVQRKSEVQGDRRRAHDCPFA